MTQSTEYGTLKRYALVGVLALMCAASGVSLVLAKHEARRLFAELEELKREHDRLQIDWGRWQLEQSTYATHSLIESVARDRLQMTTPDREQLILITEATP
jgi:cell division protein FtsL